jgi:hypothetical protein
MLRLSHLRIASGVLFLIHLLIILLSPLVIYSLPPYPARILLFTIFLSPLIWLYHYSRTPWIHYDESVLFRFLSFLGVTSFLYLLFNLQHIDTLGEGVILSEVAMLAEEYGRQGVIVRISAHSYFFQAPFLAYTLNQICGLPVHHAVFLEQGAIILLLALLSLYLQTRIHAMIPKPTPLYLFLACIVPFALVASGTRIWVPGLTVNYRDIGSYLAMVGITYIAVNGLTRRRDYVTMLLLVLGVVLGSPPAAIVLILFFTVYSLFTKQLGPAVYAILPLFYIISSAGLYMRSLMRYGDVALTGVLSAIVEVVTTGSFPDSPDRPYMVPYGDRTIETFTYLAILGVAGVVIGLRYAPHFRRSRIRLPRVYRFLSWLRLRQIRIVHPRYATLFLVLVVTLWVTLFVTLGATVMPETTFSDIRTIVFSFLLVVLPILFVTPPVYRQLQQLREQRLVLTGLLLLLCMTALLKPASVFPKSSLDAPYVIEDRRLSQTIGHAKTVLFTYYPMGAVYFDYKSNLQIVRFMAVNRTFVFRDVFYNISLISTLSTLRDSVAFFDRRGVTEPSLYLNVTDYRTAYSLSLAANIVFDDGAIIISTRYPTSR